MPFRAIAEPNSKEIRINRKLLIGLRVSNASSPEFQALARWGRQAQIILQLDVHDRRENASGSAMLETENVRGIYDERLALFRRYAVHGLAAARKRQHFAGSRIRPHQIVADNNVLDLLH